MENTSKRINNTQTSVPFIPRFIATGFFSGYSPVVPGTAGSLAGLALYAIPGIETPIIFLVATVAAFFIGTYASARMEHCYGNDPSIVVVDEIVGMWISLFFLPKSIVIATLAFLAFRFYDIVKPPPARQMEKIPGGWGIMLDDVFAGIYANVSIRVILFIFPSLG
jgi:phosphatidylglycerophosphatase A